jgi:teichuronic acid biosynthesis glycosyltransferase TuaG
MNNPLVSIVMPCYKAEKTILHSVEGILHQTYSNWELLLIVDGQNKELEAIVSSLAENEPRIRLLMSPQNRGVTRSRNIGIRLAKGEWLAFCDADDYWLTHKLATQLLLAQEKNANLVCSAFCFYYPHNQKLDLIHTQSTITYNTMLHTNAIPMSTAMVQVDKNQRHYIPQLPAHLIHEDYAFWLTLFQKRPIQVAYAEEATAHLLQSAGSRSANKWLAAKSHAYILATYGGVPRFKLAALMVSYAYNASKKRILGRLFTFPLLLH